MSSIGQGLDSLHQVTKRILKIEKTEFIEPEKFNASIDNLIRHPEDKTFKNNVTVHYRKLHHTYTQLINEENLVQRLERSSQIRNVFFRILTTLGIGFSIMFVYWLASRWGISMPLLRLPV